MRGGDGGLADGPPPSASSSSSSTMANQEMNLLMPGNQVPWWPRQGWEPWVQLRGSNVVELATELDTKIDVTPESNETSISEVAKKKKKKKKKRNSRIFLSASFFFSNRFQTKTAGEFRKLTRFSSEPNDK